MKFAKLLGICGLLAGVLGLMSCNSSSSSGLDGLWLGRDLESGAPTCMLDLKGEKLQLYFGITLDMDTTFQTQGKIDANAQGSKEESSNSEKIPITLKSDAVYDMALHSPEDAWGKVEEFYYSGGKLYMHLRYVLSGKLKTVEFEPYDENKDAQLKIYKWDEMKELQGNWSDSDGKESSYFKAKINKDHMKFYVGQELYFDGKFRIVKYLGSGEIRIIDAKTKYPHLPEDIFDGLIWKDGKLIVKTIVYDQGMQETELFKK